MKTNGMLWITGTMLGAGAAVVMFGCRQREINRRHPCVQDLKTIYRALEAHITDHDKMPSSLADLHPEYLQDKDALVWPGLALVPGSSPPTTYRYVPCPYMEHPDAIVAYVNLRGRPGDNAPLFVLRLSGQVQCLDAASFEKAIRALGEEYDSLPEAAKESRR